MASDNILDQLFREGLHENSTDSLQDQHEQNTAAFEQRHRGAVHLQNVTELDAQQLLLKLKAALLYITQRRSLSHH